MPTFTRRTLLKLTAAALVLPPLGCGGEFVPEDVPESTRRFPRTPISGDVTATRAVLAFFVADGSEVTLRLWSDEEIVVDEVVQASGDGFHKVMIDDLTPGTSYRFAVFAGEAPAFENRSLICQFKTAPAADARPTVRFALLSCVGQGTIVPDFYMPAGTSNPTTEPFQWEIFRSVAALGLELDAFVHLGDQVYLDWVWSSQGGTLQAYLDAWGYYHGGGYRDLYPLAPLYATWDDHEATDNRHFDPWDMTSEDEAKLANAHAAWYKVLPIDAMTPEDGPVWRAFRWGESVELLLLDCRYELQADHLMSEAQLAWLLDRIATSPCRFVCVATPRPFSDIATSTSLSADSEERWSNFPADRSRLTALLDDLDAKHVVFVTGDIHMNYLGRASESGEAVSDKVWEVCCTSGNTSPYSSGLSSTQFDFVAEAPHVPVLTFDPEAGTVHVVFYAVDGSIGFEQTLADL